MVVGYSPTRHVTVDAVAAVRAQPIDIAESLDGTRVVLERKYIARLLELEEQPRLAHMTSSNEHAQQQTTGRDRLTLLNEALNGFGIERSVGQRGFHRNMTMAIIHKLFKDDFAENIEFLREQFRTNEFKPEVLIITPRRFGKTWAVAMFVAACAYAIEGSNQAIFSTGRRASKSLLDRIHSFLVKLPGMRERIIVKNVETIHIQGPNGPDDIRKISSYPSKVRYFITAAVPPTNAATRVSPRLDARCRVYHVRYVQTLVSRV